MKYIILFVLNILLFAFYYFLQNPLLIMSVYVCQNIFLYYLFHKTKFFEDYNVFKIVYVTAFIVVEIISITFVANRFYTNVLWGLILSIVFTFEPWAYMYIRKKAKNKS